MSPIEKTREQLLKENQELKQALKKAGNKEEELLIKRQSASITQSPSIVVMTNPKGDIIYANPSFEKSTGYTLDEVLGKNPRILKSGKHSEQFYKEIWETIKNDKHWKGEIYNRKKDGTYYWELVNIFPIYDEGGKLINFIKTSENITNRKKAEELLRNNEARHSAMIENIGDVIAIIAANGVAKYQSPNIEKWFGWKPEELVGKEGWDMIHPEDIEKIQKEFVKLVETGNASIVEYRFKCKNGIYKWIELTATNRINDPAINGVLLNYHDITKRKQAEIVLQKSEDRLSKTLIAANDGTWDWNLITDEVYFDPRYYEMAGYTVDEFPYELEEFQKRIHPDDVENIMAQVQQHLEGKTARFDVDFRFKKKSGDWIWVMGRGQIVERDKNNKPLRFIGTHTDITKRKKAEQKLDATNKKYEHLIQSMDEGYLMTNTEEYITEANIPFAKMCGYKLPEEMLGVSMRDFFANSSDWDSMVKEITEKGKLRNYELLLQNKNGDTFWSLSNINLITNDKGEYIGSEALIHNISERKNIEVALKRSEYILNEAQQISKIGGWEYDVESRETYFSDEVFNIYGLPNDKIIKADEGIKFYHPDDIQLVSDSFEKAITQGIPYDIEVRFTNAQGKNMWVRTMGKPIYKNEKVVKILGNIMDITERKAIDKTLQEHAQELQERNEDLDAFSHTVAHDLKNPLANILGFADLLSEEYDTIPEDQAKLFINAIVKSGKKTQEIINSLLLLASVRQAEIKTTKINMGQIVKETLERLSPMILKNNAKITFSETWPTAIAYSPWIEEVLINYLSNAIKYGGTPPVIEIGYDTVKTKSKAKNKARFWVKDNGSGISAKNQTLLFKKFERLDQVKTEGYGLGLAIVERIIEKLGGDVGLESELGKGSKFYFTLPLAKEE